MPATVSLLQTLSLRDLGGDCFEGATPEVGWYRVFGGQVIAQALRAALFTVAEPAHSLHAYFIRPGDPKVPIAYQVERLRDGRSFSTRRIVASQHGKPIFSMQASFHRNEPGFDHASDMPAVPGPDSLPSSDELNQSLLAEDPPEHIRRWLVRDRPIELRPVNPRNPMAPNTGDPLQQMWFRTKEKLPADPVIHQCALAYASDFTLVDTSLVPHGSSIFDRTMMVASLDHTLWFHRPPRADAWLLYHQESPNAASARGFTRGGIYAQDGTLVASVAQEGLIRRRTAD